MASNIDKNIRTTISQLEPVVRKAFLEAVDDIKSEAQMRAIVGALLEGRLDDALSALALGQEFYGPLDRALQESYYQGGIRAIAGLPVIPDPAGLGKL